MFSGLKTTETAVALISATFFFGQTYTKYYSYRIEIIEVSTATPVTF
jgi:hypothetical protein